jgi:RecJ-like exonuclease
MMTDLCKICSGNGVLKLKYGVLTCETCWGRGEVTSLDEYVGYLELENIQLRAELARYKTPNVDEMEVKP